MVNMAENNINNINVEAEIVADDEPASEAKSDQSDALKQVAQLKSELETLTNRVDELACCQGLDDTVFSELLESSWQRHPIKRV